MTLRRALVLAPVLLVSLVVIAPAASADEATFTDTVGTVHETAVTALFEEGVIRGCDSDRFCAADEITRGQVATMLARALELPAAPDVEFSDSASSSHGPSIDSLAAAGLIAGCGNGEFCPDVSITRGQLATMLRRAFEVPAAPTGTTYFDDISKTHGDAVRALAEAGIANGCGQPSTSFCGSDNVQRAHAASLLARSLGLIDRVELRPFAEREEDERRERRQVREQQEQAAAEVAAANNDTAGARAVEVARAQLGKPYRWGGSGPHSFDCSGLTSYAWAAAGVELPRTSRDQYAATTRISRDELRPGDLIFYYSPISHVAMYIGDGKVVESPNSGNNVRIRSDGTTRRGIVGFGRP